MSPISHAQPTAPDTDWDEVARLGQEYYERHLQAQLEPAQTDRFVVIDVDSGDYFLGSTDQEAIGTATQRRPGARLHLVRVGHPAAIQLRRTR
jgi:hypothetical protein